MGENYVEEAVLARKEYDKEAYLWELVVYKWVPLKGWKEGKVVFRSKDLEEVKKVQEVVRSAAQALDVEGRCTRIRDWAGNEF